MSNDVEYWKRKLKRFNEEDILGMSSWRSHGWIRSETRGNIGSETIKWHLTHPDDLIKTAPSKKLGEGQDLYFKMSNRRILFVAILIKKIKGREKLIVKTNYIINKKKQRRLGDKRWYQ